MRFIKDNSKVGAQALAGKVVNFLKEGKKVLWLVPGGSNIPIAVEAMSMIRQALDDNEAHTNDKLLNLTVTLSDERYGHVGHKDSNWKQLEDAGFNFDGVNKMPVLIGRSLEGTVSAYKKGIIKAMKEAVASEGLVIGQFGIGADGHIAGILPHSLAATYLEADHTGKDSPLVCAYRSEPFIRITLTPVALNKVSAAYAFAFGSSKREAVGRLREQDLSIDEQPAQILKHIKESFFYTDI
jgi:6-phosphogluconolactonase/glucosamine-6-phosphate isomerase/deaminase